MVNKLYFSQIQCWSRPHKWYLRLRKNDQICVALVSDRWEQLPHHERRPGGESRHVERAINHCVSGDARVTDFSGTQGKPKTTQNRAAGSHGGAVESYKEKQIKTRAHTVGKIDIYIKKGQPWKMKSSQKREQRGHGGLTSDLISYCDIMMTKLYTNPKNKHVKTIKMLII